jgi:hypothetical protein
MVDGVAKLELSLPTRGESMWKPARYMAFIMPGGEPDNVQMIDLGEAEPIDMMITAFRRSIIGKESRNLLPIDKGSWEGADQGFALRAAIFDPLVGALKGRKRLFLAPDGDLTRLPFEALPVNKDGQCLIDEYFISYLSTGRDVLRFEEEGVVV